MKLEMHYKEKAEKHTNTWRINNMLLNGEWVNNKIKKEIKYYLETNENEHTTTQNLRVTVKAVIEGSSLHYRPTSRSKKNLLLILMQLQLRLLMW